MNIIAVLLNKTDEEYSKLVFDSFLLWCDLNSSYNAELQLLVSNQALYKWFLTQMEALELEFYENVGTLDDSAEQYYKNIEMYYAITSRVGYFHPPKSILKTVLRNGRNEINNPINNN